MLSELVKPRWQVAHRGGLLLGLSCQLCRQRRCTPHLLRHSVRFLLVPFLSPRVSSPGSSCSIPPSARAWSLTTCDHASVPTMSTSAPCATLAWMKTISPVRALTKPNHLSTANFTTLVLFVSASEGGFALGIVNFILFFLQSVQFPGRSHRPRFSTPFSADQNSDQLPYLHQLALVEALAILYWELWRTTMTTSSSPSGPRRSGRSA